MSEIFISCIHEDEIVAKALKNILEAKLHARVFLASDQLRLGDEWLSKIRAALKSARVIIALFSPAAIERPWVNFEAGGAWFSDNKTLVPICIGDLSPANLPKPYSNIQGVSLDGELRSETWKIIQDLWRVLELQPLSPTPFKTNDADVNDLFGALSHWNEAERARAAYKRRTGEDAPDK